MQLVLLCASLTLHRAKGAGYLLVGIDHKANGYNDPTSETVNLNPSIQR